MRIKLLLSLLPFLSLPALGADGDEALFGLRWGMTVAEVKAAGVTLTKTDGDRNFDIYKAPSMPKNLSDFESYSMIFADGKLVKLWGLSKNISNDPNGSNGKERFETLRTALTHKYGPPDLNSQTIGNKLFKEYDEFYQCLKYTGCGIWLSTFDTPDKDISIQLKGLSRGTGYLDITAEAKPQWSKALQVYKSKKNASDKDAL